MALSVCTIKRSQCLYVRWHIGYDVTSSRAEGLPTVIPAMNTDEYKLLWL